MQKTSKKWLQIFMLILAFGIGFLLNEVFFKETAERKSVALRKHDINYEHINPLLLCATDTPQSEEYDSLKENLQDLLSKTEGVEKTSIYYRDLETANWFGINENDKYAPASLLKLPLMIAYLKVAETQPEFFEKNLKLESDIDLNQVETYKPLHSIEIGKTYSIDELLQYMIIYSDNNAAAILDKFIAPKVKNGIYTDLGLTVPPESLAVESMSAKNYSYFFRLLYNATYVRPELSEIAIEILLDADFPDGIEGGVPEKIPIAQKFGEREIKVDNKTLYTELHSCGIVYYPEHPYILCLMTKGESFEKLSQLIQEISKTVYKYVDKKDF